MTIAQYHSTTQAIICAPGTKKMLHRLEQETEPYLFDAIMLRFYTENNEVKHYAIDPNNKDQIKQLLAQTGPSRHIIDHNAKLVQRTNNNEKEPLYDPPAHQICVHA